MVQSDAGAAGERTTNSCAGPSSTAATGSGRPPAVSQPLSRSADGSLPPRVRTGTAVSSVETSLPYSPPYAISLRAGRPEGRSTVAVST